MVVVEAAGAAWANRTCRTVPRSATSRLAAPPVRTGDVAVFERRASRQKTGIAICVDVGLGLAVGVASRLQAGGVEDAAVG